MLWKGSFCWHGEDHVIYTSSKSEAQAFNIMCFRLAKKLGYLQSTVAGHFRANATRYKIEEVKKNED